MTFLDGAIVAASIVGGIAVGAAAGSAFADDDRATAPDRPRTVEVATPHEPVQCVVYGDQIDCDWQGWVSVIPPAPTAYIEGPDGPERMDP